MSKKKRNPADSLGRFMLGIHDYYHDRGMPRMTAKARMANHTLEEFTKLMKQEEEIPDQMLVIMAQHMSRSLHSRGATITKGIEQKYPKGTPVPDGDLVSLRVIKSAKDSIDEFIETYEGWGDTDDKEG